MRSFVGSLAVWVCFALVPTTAAAQAVIAGTVRDTSGAILPGVTVEASSPALIEKVRTAVSDSTGQYRIEDLRPGTYTVNFSLTGFSAFRREGVELTGSFTATINAEMKVGALEETVTVTGESPIVDVQSARRQTVLEQRRPQGDPDRAQLQRAGRGRAWRRDQHQRRRHRHGDDAVPHSRRPQQRGSHDRRWPQRRQPARRQSAAWVIRSMSATPRRSRSRPREGLVNRKPPAW